MSDMTISQVLAQIRTLSAQAGPVTRPAAQTLSALDTLAGSVGDGATGVNGPGSAGGTGAAGSAGALPFAELLRRGIDAVNAQQQSADALSNAWERGDPGVNLARVMVEAEKASVSFQTLAQVRNRLISAYQDIMNMSI